jgi:succinate dehydrogenase/fumarate reductase cytochrome b subunit
LYQPIDINMKTTSWLLKTIRVVLNIAWYTGIALTALAFCTLTLKFFTSDAALFAAKVKYPIQETIKTLQAATPNANHVTLQADEGMIRMELKSTAVNIITAYFFFITLAFLVLTITYQLRKFFAAIQQGMPFRHDNIRRLRITALCFAWLTVLHMVYGLSTNFILHQQVSGFDSMHYQLVWEESFTGIILGAIIYLMADIFKYGFELQKENGEFV